VMSMLQNMCGLHTHSWKILSSYEDEMLIINVSLWFSVSWTMFNIVLGGGRQDGKEIPFGIHTYSINVAKV